MTGRRGRTFEEQVGLEMDKAQGKADSYVSRIREKALGWGDTKYHNFLEQQMYWFGVADGLYKALGEWRQRKDYK